MLPTFQSMLDWHSSLYSIKLISMVVLFLSSNVYSSLDLFQWTWVFNWLISNHGLVISLVLASGILRLDLLPLSLLSGALPHWDDSSQLYGHYD